MRPASTTRIWSARRIVESRCAMTNVVRPRIRYRRPSWISASDSESRLDVASSRIRILGSDEATSSLDSESEAGRCFVQNQNPRIGQDRASNRNALLLPAGEFYSAFADHRVVLILEGLCKLIHARDVASG